MTNNNIYIGIDIGSSKICVSICELLAQNRVVLKGVGTSVSSGIKDGLIVDTKEFSIALKRGLERAKRDAGVISNRVFTTVPFGAIESLTNSGILISNSSAEERGL